MHVLTVLDHPNPKSFSAAAAQQVMAGVRAAGHSNELADLHAEGFDPRWSMADVDTQDAGQIPDIAREQARIERADAICLVFPLFWWGMPAMTKGWVDRVWSWGWAYDQLEDPEGSKLRKRPAHLLVPAGTSEARARDTGQLAALETAWMQGTFGYFGLSPRRLQILYGANGSEERRQRLLSDCFATGQALCAQRRDEAGGGC